MSSYLIQRYEMVEERVVLILVILFVLDLCLLIWITQDAKRRGRNSVGWAVGVLLFGVFAVLLYLLTQVETPLGHTESLHNGIPSDYSPQFSTRTRPPCLSLPVVLCATRHTSFFGVNEQWRIKLSENTVSLLNIGTHEELTIDPKTRDCGIRFENRVGYFNQDNIILINSYGEKFSFRAKKRDADILEAWWYQHL